MAERAESGSHYFCLRKAGPALAKGGRGGAGKGNGDKAGFAFAFRGGGLLAWRVMELSDEQKQQVAGWVREGRTLADIQEAIGEEFGVQMTYMEVRFLVDDLDVTLQDKGGPPEADLSAVAGGDSGGNGAGGVETPGPDSAGGGARDAEIVDEGGPGRVSVTVDKVQRPGAMVSGNVTFSDGTGCGWQIDQMGQLGIIPSKEGYKPPAEDVQEFQIALQEELRKAGFG